MTYLDGVIIPAVGDNVNAVLDGGHHVTASANFAQVESVDTGSVGVRWSIDQGIEQHGTCTVDHNGLVVAVKV